MGGNGNEGGVATSLGSVIQGVSGRSVEASPKKAGSTAADTLTLLKVQRSYWEFDVKIGLDME
jgi:hypothetical protein